MQAVDQKSRNAASEEESTDHIGFETPGSGVATPQPDLQDKRQPEILSYFGQVRQDPSSSARCSSVSQLPASAIPSNPSQNDRHAPSPGSSPPGANQAAEDDFVSLRSLDALPRTAAKGWTASHSYPTPPTSQPPSSSASSTRGARSSEEGQRARDTRDHLPPLKPRHESQPSTFSFNALANTEPLAMSVSKTMSHTPEESCSEDVAKSPPSGPNPQSPRPSIAQTSSKWFSFEGLKELTRGAIFKSGPPTPTRALSSARPSVLEGRETPSRRSHDGNDVSGTQTPRVSSTGAQAPTTKGKLTIKIAEARGLRKSRDPYVVAVFQRSELISGGPHTMEEDDSMSATPIAIGSIPIQRSGSDSGRPPMAIPMRSRQSSNTSISDYNTFRSRTQRISFTNPKWDAEAVL